MQLLLVAGLFEIRYALIALAQWAEQYIVLTPFADFSEKQLSPRIVVASSSELKFLFSATLQIASFPFPSMVQVYRRT
uniref:Secreted protein n=1 Tax=Ascaris lumbricoides TaxID=6252 RepID=A0A0M3HY60_ASCLU